MAINRALRNKIMTAMKGNKRGVNRIDLKRQLGVDGKVIADELKNMDREGLIAFDRNYQMSLKNTPSQRRSDLTSRGSSRWGNNRPI